MTVKYILTEQEIIEIIKEKYPDAESIFFDMKKKCFGHGLGEHYEYVPTAEITMKGEFKI